MEPWAVRNLKAATYRSAAGRETGQSPLQGGVRGGRDEMPRARTQRPGFSKVLPLPPFCCPWSVFGQEDPKSFKVVSPPSLAPQPRRQQGERHREIWSCCSLASYPRLRSQCPGGWGVGRRGQPQLPPPSGSSLLPQPPSLLSCPWAGDVISAPGRSPCRVTAPKQRVGSWSRVWHGHEPVSDIRLCCLAAPGSDKPRAPRAPPLFRKVGVTATPTLWLGSAHKCAEPGTC